MPPETGAHARRTGSWPWRAKVSRRGILAGAAAAALGGCARPDRLLAGFGARTPLQVHIVGMPTVQIADLVAALSACQQAYEKAHRGFVAVRVTMDLVPDDAWYSCSPPPKPPARCPPGAYPASPSQSPQTAALLLGNPSAAGQIGFSGVPLYLVRGRTRLDVKFGGGALLRPVLSDTVTKWPDIVLGFDLWQYWLTPLATDLSEIWKTLSDDRQGLPGNFQRYARFFAPGRGTFVAAFPLLRNPMVLSNFDPVTPWTWQQVAATLQTPPPGHPGYSWDTTGFARSTLYPESTEWAAAMVVGSGGTLATATAAMTTADFASQAAETGLASVAAVVAAGPPPPPSDLQTIAVRPRYMYNPLGGVRAPFGVGGPELIPWPAGSVRTAVPCTYFCATVVAMGTRRERAQDFASFLMHPSSQRELVRWQGGLALRAAQARPQRARLFPRLPTVLAEDLISSASDLTASDLFGGEKTVENATHFDGAADRFAGTLAAIQAPGLDPAQIRRVVQNTVGT